MNRSTPGLPVQHQLPEFTQTQVHRVSDAIQPSHPVDPFSSCPQSLPASESFPMSQLFASGGQSTEVSALASFLPKKSQGWSRDQYSKASMPILSSIPLWCHNSDITTDLLFSSLSLKSKQRTLSSTLDRRHGVSTWLWKYGGSWDKSTRKILEILDPCRAFSKELTPVCKVQNLRKV